MPPNGDLNVLFAHVADEVTEPSDADDQRRDGEEISKNDPLDFLERGRELECQSWQTSIGDAGRKRRHQHGEREAGQSQANRSGAFRTLVPFSFCDHCLHLRLRIQLAPKPELPER